MNRPQIKDVMRNLRAIRGATVDDVSEAMLTRCSELQLDARTHEAYPMSSDEIICLEERGECNAPYEALFLLANVLGLGIGHVPWFIDLIYPDEAVLDIPLNRNLDLHAEALAAKQRYESVRLGGPGKLPLTRKEAAELYKKSGFIQDPSLSQIFLKRFLRAPFSPARFRVFVVAIKDGDLYPFFGPGSLILADTQEVLSPRAEPDMTALHYLCSFNEGHRCGWPVAVESRQILQTIRGGSTWNELPGAIPLGVARQTYWAFTPLDRLDFWLDDYRDQLTMDYVRSLRHQFPPQTVQ